MPARNRSSNVEYCKFLGRMIRATGRRVGRGDPEDLAALVALRGALDEAVQAAVDGLRSDGFTWSTIGKATGTSHVAALKKWGGASAQLAAAVRLVRR